MTGPRRFSVKSIGTVRRDNVEPPEEGAFYDPFQETVLDIDEGTAFWLSAGDAQTIDLKTPLLRPAAPVLEPPGWLTSLGRIPDPSLARPATAAG